MRDTLYRAGVGVDRLEIELTEGAAIRDPQGAAAVMNALYEQGIELSIDDFGTGYSSLAYLKRFPVTKLKIDRSFVRDLTIDAGDRAIVDAEGVETQEQIDFLRERGCAAMQGWLLAKPLYPDAFAAFVEARA